MGLFGSKKREETLLPEHKFDYINLADFHSSSFLAGFAYVSIFIGICISFAGHAADIYTAVNLLIFNKWSSKLEPAIDFKISKWIFAGCIILSFFLLTLEWMVAIKVLRGNGVADTYLDSIAQRWTCVFGGRGRKEDTGWKRFLVFARLTKSKSGVDYVALFAYFSFKGWMRLIFAEGPRQAINALTLYSVLKIPKTVEKGEELSAILKFFQNFGDLAKEDRAQAVVLGTMTFTLIIWVFSILQLLIAVILYMVYLCHAIGSESGLRGYCKVRVDEKLSEIVRENHRKALEKERVGDKKGGKGAGAPTPIVRQPTVPVLTLDDNTMEKPAMPKFIPPAMDANGNRIPTLPNVEKPKPTASIRSNQPRPYPPNRTGTNDSRMNLLDDQGAMGYGGRGVERMASTSQASVYTQSSRGGYDTYGNNPMGVPRLQDVVGQIRGQHSPGFSPQSSRFADIVNQVRSTPGPYAQQQRQHPSIRPGPRSDYGNDDTYSTYSGSNYTSYGGNGYDEYEQRAYNGNMYSPLAPPQSYSNVRNTVDSNTGTINVSMIPEYAEYPLRNQQDMGHSQDQYGQPINPSNVPPSSSAYPPLSKAFTDARSSNASSSLSRGPSSSSRSNHSEGRKYLNDFDFETKGSEGLLLNTKGEEIEMTTQTPSADKSSLEGTTGGSAPHKYTAYQPPSAPTRTLTSTQPPRSATAAPQMQRSGPIDYFGMEDTPRRVGTDPITNTNITRSRSPTPPLNSTSSPSSPPTSTSSRTDYFGTENTPQRIGTAPPLPSNPSPRSQQQQDSRGFNPPPRSYTAAPDNRRDVQQGVRRAETSPLDQRLPYKPRGGYGGDMV